MTRKEGGKRVKKVSALIGENPEKEITPKI